MRQGLSDHPTFGALLALAIAVPAACGGAQDSEAQEDPTPTPATTGGFVRASQPGSVSQTLAQAEITVTYNRPVARGRELFGSLVPWDSIWHPGADQATYLETTSDIRIDGRPLPAGRYSLWTRPGREEWSVYFHGDWEVFHMPFPGEEGVALELTVTPERADHMETLAFYFPVADHRSGVLALHWGETRLELPIEVPEP